MISMIVLAMLLSDNNPYANTDIGKSILVLGIDITLIFAINLLFG